MFFFFLRIGLYSSGTDMEQISFTRNYKPVKGFCLYFIFVPECKREE